MLKLLLKHKVFETAIDALFNAISKNFLVKKRPVFKKGQHYSELVVQSNSKNFILYRTFYNCDIVNAFNDQCVINYEFAEFDYFFKPHAVDAPVRIPAEADITLDEDDRFVYIIYNETQQPLGIAYTDLLMVNK